jgi:hypothetical protein
MRSNLERRLSTLESLRDDKRKLAHMTNAELLELRHGRKLSISETEDYMRQLDAIVVAKMEAKNAKP